MQRGPRLKRLPLADWVRMKELLAELTILRKRLETLQVKLEQADKRQRNKLHNRLKPRFPALGVSQVMPLKPYKRRVR